MLVIYSNLSEDRLHKHWHFLSSALVLQRLGGNFGKVRTCYDVFVDHRLPNIRYI